MNLKIRLFDKTYHKPIIENIKIRYQIFVGYTIWYDCNCLYNNVIIQTKMSEKGVQDWCILDPEFVSEIESSVFQFRFARVWPSTLFGVHYSGTCQAFVMNLYLLMYKQL